MSISATLEFVGAKQCQCHRPSQPATIRKLNIFCRGVRKAGSLGFLQPTLAILPVIAMVEGERWVRETTGTSFPFRPVGAHRLKTNSLTSAGRSVLHAKNSAIHQTITSELPAPFGCVLGHILAEARTLQLSWRLRR